MSFASIPFGESTLAGVGIGTLAPPGGSSGTPGSPGISLDPFTVEIDSVALKPLIDSLSISAEYSRQGTASFTLANPEATPRIGQPVRILFYSEVLFVGHIDSIRLRSNHTQTFKTYDIECTDNAYLLFRKKVNRSFTNMTVGAIANSLIAQELSNDSITLGVVTSMPVIPFLDASNITAFDVLSEAAAASGMTFHIDHNRTLIFRSSVIPSAPMTIDENIVEDCSLSEDRQAYRNQQTIIINGTAVSPDTPKTITVKISNSDQIIAQALIEGTSGVYSDIESITHPTSNDTIELTKLAYAYARIRLGVTGAIRRTISIKTRQYGFQPGQMATLSIPHVGAAGNFLIQKVSWRDESGRYLITDMDLSLTNLTTVKQLLWLDVVRKGKTVILPPSVITSNAISYVDPGVYNFTVPAGVSFVVCTAKGAGGGGGGGARSTYLSFPEKIAQGGPGGNGGLTITVLPVVEGDPLTVTVGAQGAAGVNVQQLNQTIAANGVAGGTGGTSKVSRPGGDICLAYGGQGGSGGYAQASVGGVAAGVRGADGDGLFGSVTTVGGGSPGGSPGRYNPTITPTAGGRGFVMLEW